MRVWRPDGGSVIKSWTDDIEPEAVKQLENTARMPFIFKHVAVMPDVHLGKGATVGSVVATENAIMPACVGVDLGCGMQAVKLDWINPERAQERKWEIFKQLERRIPSGRHCNSDQQMEDSITHMTSGDLKEVAQWLIESPLKGMDAKFRAQLGTLGGGNHFIELCVSEKNEVWLVLHSGSRGLGNMLANHHINIAKNEMKAMFIDLPDPDLAYFVRGKKEFTDYIRDMLFAQKFAKWNRRSMMQLCLGTLRRMFDYDGEISEPIDCHHNFVEIESHFDRNVFVTRKGAVRARTGEFGIIPGSMGTRSYIVAGKGNVESFCSCSHGAGRAMSRTRARKDFTEEQHREALTGVACNVTSETLDETPGAYKPIEKVIAEQSDLVDVLETLKQFVCIKGLE